ERVGFAVDVRLGLAEVDPGALQDEGEENRVDRADHAAVVAGDVVGLLEPLGRPAPADQEQQADGGHDADRNDETALDDAVHGAAALLSAPPRGEPLPFSTFAPGRAGILRAGN